MAGSPGQLEVAAWAVAVAEGALEGVALAMLMAAATLVVVAVDHAAGAEANWAVAAMAAATVLETAVALAEVVLRVRRWRRADRRWRLAAAAAAAGRGSPRGGPPGAVGAACAGATGSGGGEAGAGGSSGGADGIGGGGGVAAARGGGAAAAPRRRRRRIARPEEDQAHAAQWQHRQRQAEQQRVQPLVVWHIIQIIIPLPPRLRPQQSPPLAVASRGAVPGLGTNDGPLGYIMVALRTITHSHPALL